MSFEAGQQWTYRAPSDLSGSRIVIGALVDFGEGRCIACCAVTGALQKGDDGSVVAVDVPFVPMTIEALAQSVLEADGEGALPDAFAEQLAIWQSDPKGLSYFTVPFEGSLERMIALQMQAIVEQPDSATPSA